MARKRTVIDPIVRSYLEEEARNDREANWRQLNARVRKRLRQEGKDFPLPKARAIQVIAQRERKKPGPSLNDPWSLGISLPEISAEATGDLLAVLKLCVKGEERFTIRQAKWVARLRTALPDAHPATLLKWATIYGYREREHEQSPNQMDTTDLDAELAFQPSKSALHKWEYDQAVQTGAVPETQAARGGVPDEFTARNVPTAMDLYSPIPFGYFLRNGRAFLWEIGGPKVDKSLWLPHAESVMAFWLREITARVSRWTGIDLGSGGGLPGREEREQWKAMGRRLAEMVIQEAQRLQEWENTWQATRDEREKFDHEIRHMELDAERSRKAGDLREEYSLYDQINELHTQESELLHGLKGYWERWRPEQLLKEVV